MSRRVNDLPRRGAVVLWSGHGLYVVLDSWAGPTGQTLMLSALEGQPDENSVEAWRVRVVTRPTAEHQAMASKKAT